MALSIALVKAWQADQWEMTLNIISVMETIETEGFQIPNFGWSCALKREFCGEILFYDWLWKNLSEKTERNYHEEKFFATAQV